MDKLPLTAKQTALAYALANSGRVNVITGVTLLTIAQIGRDAGIDPFPNLSLQVGYMMRDGVLKSHTTDTDGAAFYTFTEGAYAFLSDKSDKRKLLTFLHGYGRVGRSELNCPTSRPHRKAILQDRANTINFITNWVKENL